MIWGVIFGAFVINKNYSVLTSSVDVMNQGVKAHGPLVSFFFNNPPCSHKIPITQRLVRFDSYGDESLPVVSSLGYIPISPLMAIYSENMLLEFRYSHELMNLSCTSCSLVTSWCDEKYVWLMPHFTIHSVSGEVTLIMVWPQGKFSRHMIAFSNHDDDDDDDDVDDDDDDNHHNDDDDDDL